MIILVRWAVCYIPISKDLHHCAVWAFEYFNQFKYKKLGISPLKYQRKIHHVLSNSCECDMFRIAFINCQWALVFLGYFRGTNWCRIDVSEASASLNNHWSLTHLAMDDFEIDAFRLKRSLIWFCRLSPDEKCPQLSKISFVNVIDYICVLYKLRCRGFS